MVESLGPAYGHTFVALDRARSRALASNFGPTRTIALARTARALAAVGRRDDAEAVLVEAHGGLGATAAQAERVRALVALAEAYLAIGDGATAASMVREADSTGTEGASVEPPSPSGYHIQSLIDLANSAPMFAPLELCRSKVLAASGRLDEALEAASRVTDWRLGSLAADAAVEGWLDLVRPLLEHGELREGLRQLQRLPADYRTRRALTRAAIRRVAGGQIGPAYELLDAVWQPEQREDVAEVRIRRHMSLAGGFAMAGRPELAEGSVLAAVEEGEHIQAKDARLARLLDVIAGAGKLKVSAELVARLLGRARQQLADLAADQQTRALANLLYLQARYLDLEGALECLYRMPPSGERDALAVALAELLLEQARTEDATRALAAVTQDRELRLLDLARLCNHPGESQQSWGWIVEALGRPELLPEAIATAATVAAAPVDAILHRLGARLLV